MSRLDVVRAFFIERFFAALESDAEFAGLAQPAELFDGAGRLAVTADAAGFARIPSPEAIRRRAATAPGAERADLERFGRALGRALREISAAGPLDSARVAKLAERFCPYVHHQLGQRFLPVSMADYLRVQGLGLQSKLYTATGQRSLIGDIPGALFENPEVWNAPPASPAPYTAKVPFVAAVGVGGAVAGFPQTSLKFGALDLSAADVCLAPARMPPTIYVEAKTVYGALRLNGAYQAAAAGGGRFAPLRNNRIHQDPVLGDRRLELAGAATTLAATAVSGAEDGLLLIYHLFYGLDDGARRWPGVLATNREFHHLAIALAFDSLAGALDGGVPSLTFTSEGPDRVGVTPWSHPGLFRFDHQGARADDGDHVVGFSRTAGARRRARIELKQRALEAQQEAAAERGEAEDTKAQGNAAAAGAGVLGAGALGAGVPAAAALLFALAALLVLLSHAMAADGNQRAADLEHSAGADDSAADKLAEDQDEEKRSLEEDRQNDVAWYEAPPGPRRARLEVIPHGADRNLYGLRADGPDTLAIDDDPALREMLAWWAFPGGVGYQFDCPGARDAAGSSFRSYFDLFLRKLVELREAHSLVTYFGA